MKKAHWFIIFLFVAVSCLDQPDCFRLNNNIIGIAFKKMYDGKADTVAIIGIKALAAPDFTFSELKYTNGAYVPLNYFATQTALTVQDLEETHHLLLGYEVKTQFVSDDCGARYVLTNLQLLEEDYDSIRVVGTTPSASDVGVHLEIFRCPRTHLMKLVFQQLQTDGTSAALTPKIEGILPDYTGGIFGDTTLSSVNLPLNPAANAVKFDVDFRDYGVKFLTVQYQSEDWNYQPKYCAPSKIYSQLTVGNKGEAFDFDSVTVVRDSLQDPPITNVTAFRCPDTHLVRLSFRISAVRADNLPVSKITNNLGEVVFGTDTTSAFTLPLITAGGATETEFTFEFTDGTASKKIRIAYEQADADLPFAVCSGRIVLNNLAIASTDFASGPTTPEYLPKVDHTTYPPSTNFEITR
jgi:hypothetical protein